MSNVEGWEADVPDPEEPVSLPDAVVEAYAASEGSPGGPDEAVSALMVERGDAFYSDLLYSLTHLRYPSEKAAGLWQKLREHRQLLEQRLGRDVGVRVAALDYFCNIRGELASPRVVEPKVLERLRQFALTDPLTGLGNRRLYKERLAAEFIRARRYRSPFVVALFDIDNFKAINDRHGHVVGDQVLRRVAQCIKNSIRKADTAARWGGEEFVLLMPETHKRGGGIQAERLRLLVELEGAELGATISGGVAGYPLDGEDERSLFQFADRALYRSKAEGKNRVRLAPMERRAFPRLDETLPLRLELLDGAASSIESTTANISHGGLAIRHGDPLPISTRVKGSITFPGGQVPFMGKIVYVEEMSDRLYDVGIQFLEIDETARQLVLAHSD